MCARRRGIGAVALALLGGNASCLPADTRPPPGSILLTVASGDEPVTMTEDGWAITVDRLILGIGGLRLGGGPGPGCNDYSESNGYLRLLDGRLPDDQKLGVIYGLGRCYFGFEVSWPSSDSLLGEGVSEADRERMEGSAGRVFHQGSTVDFSATATRGTQTKRLHWQLRQPATYPRCFRKPPAGAPPQPIELRGDENLAFHIVIRGTALFADDADPATAKLRFDPIAQADGIGGLSWVDGEVTLNELRAMPMDAVRQSGPYGVPATMTGGPNSMPRSLEDYMYRVLLRGVAGFREDVSCDNNLLF